MRYPLPVNTATATFFDGNDRTATDLDVEALGRHGSGRVTVKVLGYWSSDVIYLYIDRRTNYSIGAEAEQPYWRFEMSHSSGGRDLGAEPDSLVAEGNFAEALTQLAVWGRAAREALSAELEAAYQREREEAKRQIANSLRLRAADTPLGENGAKALLASLEAEARQDLGTMRTTLVFPRGLDETFSASAKCIGGQIKFYLSGTAVSRKSLAAKLAEASHRSAKKMA